MRREFPSNPTWSAGRADRSGAARCASCSTSASVLPTCPMPWAQRLGYLLERIDQAPEAKLLKNYVRKHAHEAAALVPSEPVAGHPRDADWKLVVNADVEAET
jgi:hypothetical protein